jgi:Concanavalin A-like lectin/glucanases superfamily
MHKHSLSIAAVVCLIACPTLATAGVCDAYYSFDGTLTDSSGNQYDGEMFDKEDKPVAPSFAEGKFGQALQLDGIGAMRSYLDLHFEACPQVTISAWIQVPRAASTDTLHILSSGRGSGPGLRVSDTMLVLSGTNNGIAQQNAIRKGGGWIFVAGVNDYEAGYFQLHWQGRSTPRQKLADYRYPPENAFWVGTWHDESGDRTRGVVIDELRITGRAFRVEQVAALRTRSPQTTDTERVQDDVFANPGDQLPGDQYEPRPDSSAGGISGVEIIADSSGGTDLSDVIDYETRPDSDGGELLSGGLYERPTAVEPNDSGNDSSSGAATPMRQVATENKSLACN